MRLPNIVHPPLVGGIFEFLVLRRDQNIFDFKGGWVVLGGGGGYIFFGEVSSFCVHFFSLLSGHLKPTKPLKLLSFFNHLVSLEGPPNHPASKDRTFGVNVNSHDSY